MTTDRNVVPINWPECRRCRRQRAVLLKALLCLATVLGIFHAWRLFDPDAESKPVEAVHCLEFLEQLSLAADLGIIQVDRRRLDEMVCIATEARWEEQGSPESEAFGSNRRE